MPTQPGRVVVRLIGMRAVIVVAAAAVCVAASACTSGQPSPVSAPSGTSSPRPDGMPRYYLTVAGLEVVVRASGDGHMTGAVRMPVRAGDARSLVEGEPFRGGDDRHFVIVVLRGGDLPGVAEVSLFQVSVSADGRPGRPSQVAFGGTQGVPVTGAALSPDGRILALSLVHDFPAGAVYGSVEVISVATGVTRSWTGESLRGYWPGVPAWAGDGTVVVPWWHDTGHGMSPAEVVGVRRVALGSRDGGLAGARLTAFAAPATGVESAMVAPGGERVVAASCLAAHRVGIARVAELSAGDGRLVRVLRTETAQFKNDTDAAEAVASGCRVLSVAGDGDQVLVQAFGFGRIEGGVFTGLPGATAGVLPVEAAW